MPISSIILSLIGCLISLGILLIFSNIESKTFLHPGARPFTPRCKKPSNGHLRYLFLSVLTKIGHVINKKSCISYRKQIKVYLLFLQLQTTCNQTLLIHSYPKSGRDTKKYSYFIYT